MRLVKIAPPGTLCLYQALFEKIEKLDAKSFIEIGCGAGDLSLHLCQLGMNGVGIDSSAAALAKAMTTLKTFINSGRYRIVEGDIMADKPFDSMEKADLAISLMVMEHIEDDLLFLTALRRYVKPGGVIIIAVPGRRQCWGIEDETVGHWRRYDRRDLVQVLTSAGLQSVDVWSVAVPTANLLFRISNYLIRRSGEASRIGQTKEAQTATSGIREIPFKTVFPSWLRFILNPVALYPLFALQRFFYGSDWGLTMLGEGRNPQL